MCGLLVAYHRINPSNIPLTPGPYGTPVFIDFARPICYVDVKVIRDNIGAAYK